jgi:hypothetical protein
MKKKVKFKATQSLSLENSFGTVKEQKDVELNVIINIFDAQTGSFELYDDETGGDDWYAEGGLWFNGKDLTDYDGVFALPKVIEKKLIEMGYNTEL